MPSRPSSGLVTGSFAPSAERVRSSEHGQPREEEEVESPPVVETRPPPEPVPPTPEELPSPPPAAAEPAVPPAAEVVPEAVDPGARALVESIVAGVGSTSGVTRLGIRDLRNQSRAMPTEFTRFTERFAALLSSAGDDLALEVSTDVARPVDYEMAGTAYLVTADGFDQWELYLRISPVDERWSVWESPPDRPVRVLRFARPGVPQLTRGPGFPPD